MFVFGKKRVNAWWWILCARKLLDCAITTASPGGKPQVLFLFIRKIVKKIILFLCGRYIYISSTERTAKTSMFSQKTGNCLFVFQEEIWEDRWTELLNNMKCWSDTGQRLLTNSESLSIPPCRAHGTVGHWFAGKTRVFPSCKMFVI